MLGSGDHLWGRLSQDRAWAWLPDQVTEGVGSLVITSDLAPVPCDMVGQSSEDRGRNYGQNVVFLGEKKFFFNQILFLTIWSLKTPANTVIL